MVGVPYGRQRRHHLGILFPANSNDILALVDYLPGGGPVVHQHLQLEVLRFETLRAGLLESQEILPAELLALGAVEPAPRQAEGAAVGRMHLRASGHQRIQLAAPEGVEIIIYVLEYLVHIIALGRGVEGWILHHLVHLGEEAGNVPLHPESFALPEYGRSVVRGHHQGLIEVIYGQGILILRQFLVAHQRKGVGIGVLLGMLLHQVEVDG